MRGLRTICGAPESLGDDAVGGVLRLGRQAETRGRSAAAAGGRAVPAVDVVYLHRVWAGVMHEGQVPSAHWAGDRE